MQRKTNHLGRNTLKLAVFTYLLFSKCFKNSKLKSNCIL